MEEYHCRFRNVYTDGTKFQYWVCAKPGCSHGMACVRFSTFIKTGTEDNYSTHIKLINIYGQPWFGWSESMLTYQGRFCWVMFYGFVWQVSTGPDCFAMYGLPLYKNKKLVHCLWLLTCSFENESKHYHTCFIILHAWSHFRWNFVVIFKICMYPLQWTHHD